MPSPAITLRDVHKRYGEITAVGGLDLDVPAGTCLGLLGPNGAGKSTTMRMLTAQTIADSGEIEVLGHRLPREAKQARARCGVVPQLNNLDFELTVRQNLAVFARLYRVPKDEREDAIPRALEMANLAGRADSVVTSSRAGCDAACSSPAASCTGPSSCSSTNRPSGSTRRCARSCGHSSTSCARRA